MPSQLIKDALNTHKNKLLEEARIGMQRVSEGDILYEKDFSSAMFRLNTLLANIKDINAELNS